MSHAPLHPNYAFVLHEADKVQPVRGRILDLGCGKGDVVLAARERGWDAHGIEYFSHGSGTNIREILIERGLLGNAVCEYDGANIPFDDGFFDVIVSN